MYGFTTFRPATCCFDGTCEVCKTSALYTLRAIVVLFQLLRTLEKRTSTPATRSWQDTLLDQVPGYKVWNVEALRIWGPHDSAVAFQLGNGLKFVVGSDQNPIILVYFRFQHTSLGLCGSWTWRSTCQSTWTEIMLWIKGPSLWFVASGGCGRPFLLSSSSRGSKQIIQQPIP